MQFLIVYWAIIVMVVGPLIGIASAFSENRKFKYIGAGCLALALPILLLSISDMISIFIFFVIGLCLFVGVPFIITYQIRSDYKFKRRNKETKSGTNSGNS